jgi:nucleoside-diphosphate-sugar epimerase
MHVFVTGATGFVGRAVINELISAGHTVTGLARSEGAAAALKARGVNVLRGSLQDWEILKQGATEADGVINLAMDHDFSKYAESCLAEQSAIQVLGSAMIGTNKPLITTSGTLVLTKGKLSTEDELVDFEAPMNLRAKNETVVTELAQKGVRACVIRLPPTVHGEEDHGFIHMCAALARSQGNAIYIDEGLNRWPAVNRLDAAKLYRLVLEKGVTGSRYHAVDEEGVAMKEIAEAIGQSLGLPVVSKTPDEAQRLDNFVSFVMSADNPTSSKKTRELLGWEPVGRKLLDDIKAGLYFQR